MGEENAPARRPEGHTLYEDGSIVFEEFEEGDPRRGPHSLSVQNDAEAWARVRGRWHQRKRYVDWFAIRLVFGRGFAALQAGKMFGIETSSVRRRAQEDDWVSPMAACDRRELSVLVWLAGWRRIDPGDAGSRAALKKASEWRLRKEQKTVWREKERHRGPFKFTINDEIPDDAYFSETDPKREERQSLIDDIDGQLREVEAQWQKEFESEEEDDHGAEDEEGAAEAPEEVGDVAVGMGEAGES